MGARKIAAVVSAFVIVGAAVAYAALELGDRGYHVRLVMPSAAQLYTGSPVWVEGQRVGQVEKLGTRDGKAVVTIGVNDDVAPLHTGTTFRVEWKSLIGERVVTIYRGPERNPTIPNGAMYQARSLQIELDQVLAALDAPTRKHLTSLLRNLNDTTKGNEENIQQTLQSAGPAINGLGDVLDAVGRDGPAIKQLVSQMRQVSGTLADKPGDIRRTVRSFTRVTGAVSTKQQAVRQAISVLPSTLNEARRTLDDVPAASKPTVALLKTLQPSTRRLPTVSTQLNGVLGDLRPVVSDLRPTLAAANRLLGRTPTMLDSAHAVLPGMTQAVGKLRPAVRFLRPYTPEAVGWLTNWGQAFAAYDSQGHYWSSVMAPGLNANDESVAMPPGFHTASTPPPGQLVDQPWTDANGNGMR